MLELLWHKKIVLATKNYIFFDLTELMFLIKIIEYKE